MKRTLMLALLALLALPLIAGLGGCVVYTDGGYGYHHHYWHDHDRY